MKILIRSNGTYPVLKLPSPASQMIYKSLPRLYCLIPVQKKPLKDVGVFVIRMQTLVVHPYVGDVFLVTYPRGKNTIGSKMWRFEIFYECVEFCLFEVLGIYAEVSNNLLFSFRVKRRLYACGRYNSPLFQILQYSLFEPYCHIHVCVKHTDYIR